MNILENIAVGTTNLTINKLYQINYNDVLVIKQDCYCIELIISKEFPNCRPCNTCHFNDKHEKVFHYHFILKMNPADLDQLSKPLACLVRRAHLREVDGGERGVKKWAK